MGDTISKPKLKVNSSGSIYYDINEFVESEHFKNQVMSYTNRAIYSTGEIRHIPDTELKSERRRIYDLANKCEDVEALKKAREILKEKTKTR